MDRNAPLDVRLLLPYRTAGKRGQQGKNDSLAVRISVLENFDDFGYQDLDRARLATQGSRITALPALVDVADSLANLGARIL